MSSSLQVCMCYLGPVVTSRLQIEYGTLGTSVRVCPGQWLQAGGVNVRGGKFKDTSSSAGCRGGSWAGAAFWRQTETVSQRPVAEQQQLQQTH